MSFPSFSSFVVCLQAGLLDKLVFTGCRKQRKALTKADFEQNDHDQASHEGGSRRAGNRRNKNGKWVTTTS